MSGVIIYQDLLAPELDLSPVSNVKVEAFRQPEVASSQPVAETYSGSNGSYSLNLTPYGPGDYRLQFTKDYHMFTLRNGVSSVSDIFHVPSQNITPTVLGMKYSLGAYGLSPVDELASYASRAESRIPFVRFAIPSVKVPNTILPCPDTKSAQSCATPDPCNVEDDNHFCFDRYRTNKTMRDRLAKMGQTNFDVKLIMNAALWKEYK